MIYIFLITIVFIAEVIITISIIQALLRVDKKIIEFDDTMSLINPSIKDISELVKKISSQMVEFSERFAEKFGKKKDEFFIKQLFKMLLGIFFVKTNIKVARKIQKTKVFKALAKGLSLLEIMV